MRVWACVRVRLCGWVSVWAHHPLQAVERDEKWATFFLSPHSIGARRHLGPRCPPAAAAGLSCAPPVVACASPQPLLSLPVIAFARSSALFLLLAPQAWRCASRWQPRRAPPAAARRRTSGRRRRRPSRRRGSRQDRGGCRNKCNEVRPRSESETDRCWGRGHPAVAAARQALGLKKKVARQGGSRAAAWMLHDRPPCGCCSSPHATSGREDDDDAMAERATAEHSSQKKAEGDGRTPLLRRRATTINYEGGLLASSGQQPAASAGRQQRQPAGSSSS